MGNNMVGWFEIPVTDMERAKSFYETVFQVKIETHDFGGILMGWFPSDDIKTGCSGSLVQLEEWYIPNRKEGVLIYFSSVDVQNELDRIEASGGRILKPKTQISPDIGYKGLFHDTEGNRIALHSKK